MTGPKSDPIRLFSRKEETFNLIFPLFFIAAAIAEILFFRRVWLLDQQLKDTWMFLALFLFLNYLHVFFTPYFLILRPEGRKWFLEKCRIDNSHWWILLIALIAGYRFFSFNEQAVSPMAAAIFLGILTLFANYHNASQTYGLSLLYNKLAINENPDKKSQINRMEKYERTIFYIQFSLISVSFASAQIPILRRLTTFLFPVSIGLSLIYFYLVYVQSKGIKTNKLLYCLRFLLYTLAIKSFFARIGFLSFHGIEYLFVTKKIFSSEKGNKKTANVIFLFILAVVVLAGAFSTEWTRNVILSYWQNAPVTTFILLHSLFSIFVFLHYWIDGLMFKSKDPLSRQYILSALLKPGR